MDCIFCKIKAGEIPAQIVYRDDEIIAFRDINPKAPSHLLVIPNRHIETLADLKEEDTNMIGRLVLVANQIASEEGFSENGYRLVMNCREHGGQEVYHLHLHLLGGRQMMWPPG
ncbi:histidine triad nucleotide-binding protein [bacterium]|nr:histidine triad nucleotide-binding protein [bacterium]MBU1650922.1 histidine triad nucleotide-binding protein [bacterium]MBU1881908.1 histidine triad nucleotide-binding protein [bacterium]